MVVQMIYVRRKKGRRMGFGEKAFWLYVGTCALKCVARPGGPKPPKSPQPQLPDGCVAVIVVAWLVVLGGGAVYWFIDGMNCCGWLFLVLFALLVLFLLWAWWLHKQS